MHRWSKVAVLALAILIVPARSAHTQVDPPADPLVGIWEGALTIPGGKLRLALRVTRDGDTRRAVMDSLDQGARDIPTSGLTFDGKQLTVELAVVQGRYVATLDEDGQTLRGTWHQGGTALPLVMVRVEKVSELKRPQNPVGPLPYRVVEVACSYCPGELANSFRPEFAGEGERIRLAGTLTLPLGDGPHPAVVLISGSGPQDRDETLLGHKPFLVLADHLTRAGIAVLRYDDRGVGASKGDFAAATTLDLAEDARAVLRLLRMQPTIDPARTGLAGHSEGGVIAPLVANADPELVAFIVLLGGTGVDGRAIVSHQARLISAASGVPAETIAAQAVIRDQMLDLAAAREPEASTRRQQAATLLEHFIEALPADQRDGLGPRDVFIKAQLDAFFSPWFSYFLGHDPAIALRQVRCPVLALFGARDLQVDPRQNLGPMATALAAAPTQDITLTVLPELNHLFQRCQSGSPTEYGQIEQTCDPTALNLISRWINERR